MALAEEDEQARLRRAERHVARYFLTVSLVNIYGARDRGNTGTDLNAIPLLAIDRIEILRDGAAAQYGSDAIAGVMNIALKRSKGCETVLGWGQYSRGDGENWLASAYCGVGFAMGGGLSVTGEWQDRDRSNRATDFNPLRTIGDSKVTNRTVYLNGDAPLGEVAEVYFTAGMQNRDASSAAWARGGIGSDDIPSRNSEAMYPDGFVPFIDGVLDDRYGIIGLRGEAGAWHWDMSYTHGYNEFNYTIRNTLNASIANLDLINGGGDAVFRETIKDYFLNTSFRKDVYVRGARSMPALRQKETLQELHMVTVVPRHGVHLKLKLGNAEIDARPDIYLPVMDALSHGPKSLHELSRLPALQALSPVTIWQVAALLVASGQAALHLAHLQHRGHLAMVAIGQRTRRAARPAGPPGPPPASPPPRSTPPSSNRWWATTPAARRWR